MKRLLFATLVAGAVLCSSQIARADFWGGDDAILAQILAESISQLAELKSLLQSSGDTLGFLKEVNRGLNDAMQMAQTLGVKLPPGLYGNLISVPGALAGIESIFGAPPDSPLKPVQFSTDQSVAEAVSFNNELDSYADNLDQIGEEIKTYSHAASPGGAQKLTAQSLGVVIHVLDQQLRASGQGLKLQAQALAIQNKKDKDQTGEYLSEVNSLQVRMSTFQPTFQVPRF